MKSIETQITINAPMEIIWSHLTDFNHYPEWNAFIPSISGELKEGATWNVEIHPPGGRMLKFAPKCTKMETGKRFQWKGNLFMPGLFDGEHIFSLARLGDNETLLQQSENFSGLLVPIFWKSMYAKTLTGFNLMNQQLKERVEAAIKV